MHFELRLVNIWKFLTLSVIISMTLLFSVIGRLFVNELLCVLLGFPILFGSMIISAFLSTSKKEININNGILTINNRTHIAIDQIEWYNQETNFLFDGMRIKTIQKKNYYFSTLNLFHRESNFKTFKDILINKSGYHEIPEKTTHQLFVENKFLRHSASVLMILYAILILLTLFTDLKIDKAKLLYTGLIILGTFISTRK